VFSDFVELRLRLSSLRRNVIWLPLHVCVCVFFINGGKETLVLGDNINTINKNKITLMDASKEVGVEINAEILITPWLWSASELYRPSDRRLLAKLVSTFARR
jgi:hypothetical protein